MSFMTPPHPEDLSLLKNRGAKLIIVHGVSDPVFSVNDTTVPAAQRGTYLAFTQSASNGMRHLRQLAGAGLTHVHLLPAFDIATIDEVRANHQQPACDLTSFPPASTEQQACVMAVAIDGNAVLTIVVSSICMNAAVATSHSMGRRDGKDESVGAITLPLYLPLRFRSGMSDSAPSVQECLLGG